MRFLKLTYYKTGKNYGTSGGPTEKVFYVAINTIVRITEYPDSVKLSLTDGEDIEVCEPLEEILQELRAMHVYL